MQNQTKELPCISGGCVLSQNWFILHLCLLRFLEGVSQRNLQVVCNKKKMQGFLVVLSRSFFFVGFTFVSGCRPPVENLPAEFGGVLVTRAAGGDRGG